MKFHYKDKVRVIGGFYTGSSGIVIDYRKAFVYTSWWGLCQEEIPEMYFVVLKNDHEHIPLLEKELEHV